MINTCSISREMPTKQALRFTDIKIQGTFLPIAVQCMHTDAFFGSYDLFPRTPIAISRYWMPQAAKESKVTGMLYNGNEDCCVQNIIVKPKIYYVHELDTASTRHGSFSDIKGIWLHILNYRSTYCRYKYKYPRVVFRWFERRRASILDLSWEMDNSFVSPEM